MINIINNNHFIVPTDIINWVVATLQECSAEGEINIVLLTNDEIQQLNKQYRDKDKPTNVLAFPSQQQHLPKELQNCIGDIAIAPNIIELEAIEQHKIPDHHFAHITIHGVLHLLGYDHYTPVTAETMEAKEILILQQFNINNPYQEQQHDDN